MPECFFQRLALFGFSEQESIFTLANKLGRPVGTGNQSWQPRSHRLQDRVGAGVVKCGMNEPISPLVDGGQIGHFPQRLHSFAEPMALKYKSKNPTTMLTNLTDGT